MSWIEDTVSFRGYVRRSGNSLVVTIPAELSQRFLIKEGQEFIILGMGRKTPDFEGALQIYLGYFVVYEKAPVVFLKITNVKGEQLEVINQVAKMLGSTYVTPVEDGVKIVLGSIERGVIKRARSMEEAKSIAASLVAELKSHGIDVEEYSVSEEILERRDLDPSVVSKAPSKAGENIRYKWEL
ncbi:MAG TPA: hypothetical protein EYP20_04705 [Aigarchaeota archaeon]|nr:hypothetical protein [Aigarchaeota archaeon]